MTPIALLVARTALAGDVTVCTDGPPTCDTDSLAEALDFASAGDVVHFTSGGTWAGAFRISKGVDVVNDLWPAELVSLESADGVNDIVTIESADEVLLDGVDVGGLPGGPRNVTLLGGSRLVYTHGTIRNGLAAEGAGVDVSSGAELVMSDAFVTGNVATAAGGGIKVHALGTVELTRVDVRGNAAPVGAGLSLDHSEGTLDSCTFADNVASAWYGGGVYLVGGSLTVRGGSFLDNSAIAGGAITVDTLSTAAIEDASFDGNKALSGPGGAIYAQASGITVEDSSFTGNTASQGGGGVAAYGWQFATVSGSDFTDNGAGLDGGGLLLMNGSVPDWTLSDSTFTGNDAGNVGGAVFWQGSGGDSALATVDDVSLTDNAALTHGGLALFSGDKAIVTDVTAEGNDLGIYGAAVAFESVTHVEAHRLRLCFNEGGEGASLYLAPRQDAEVTNLIVVGASAGSSPGLIVNGPGALVRHAAFLDNTASFVGSGVVGQNAYGELQVDTTVFTGSSPLAFGPSLGALSTAYMDWWQNDGLGVGVAPTDLSLDPLWLDPSSGPDCGRNLRPDPLSPLIDAGPALPADGDGSAQDIGPYGGAEAWGDDADADGVDAAEDCDDLDPTRFPGADEHCDGFDEDCDGLIDEDAVDPGTWFVDLDGDQYGGLTVAAVACEGPAGTVTSSDDCDEADASIHPGADEWCDDVDADCDGLLDDPEALDAVTVYGDLDGDGFGAGPVLRSCNPPAGVSDVDGDCDDANAAVHPGATEVFYDGLDGDCAGGSDFDADVDGVDSDQHGGADCDDTDASIGPFAEDTPGDEVDQDCDGVAAASALAGAGCGCDSRGPGPTAAWVGLMFGAWLRGRRRGRGACCPHL